jgi:hypothetical protein
MALPASAWNAAALSAAAAAKNNSMVAARLSNAAAVKSTYATLELSAQADGRSWEAGCTRLGMQAKTSIFSQTPTMDELVAFFQTPCEWIFMSGHFLYGSGKFYSDKGVSIVFSDDAVDMTVGGERRRLTKAGGDFRLHFGCSLVVIAACSALHSDGRIRSFRTLFDNPVLLGYAAMCGVAINQAMLGGGFIANAFFGRVRNKRALNDRNAARDAWMETANAGYGGGAIESMFRAVDQDGQEWMLSGKQIVKGRKL